MKFHHPAALADDLLAIDTNHLAFVYSQSTQFSGLSFDFFDKHNGFLSHQFVGWISIESWPSGRIVGSGAKKTVNPDEEQSWNGGYKCCRGLE